jgi:hypothetical protein
LDGKWKSAAVRAREFAHLLARRAPYHSDEFLNVASIGGALADFSQQQKRAARAFFFQSTPASAFTGTKSSTSSRWIRSSNA